VDKASAVRWCAHCGATESEPPVADGVDIAEMRRQLPYLAVEHGDEHVTKLTEAALRTHAATADVTPLVAAEQMRHRIPWLRAR
jgi:hypothetical protein